MATVATLTIDLIGESAKLRSELKKANKSTKSWADKTRQQVNSAAKFMAGAATVGAGALAAIYTEAAKSADGLAKLSDQLGIAPERLTALQHAAELTGVGTEKMNSSLTRMVKRVGEAKNGMGAAAKTLERFGLSNEEFFKLEPADQFALISDKVNGLSSQQEKAAAAAAIFGREGIALVNTMKLGADGIKAAEEEVKALGITLDRVELAKIEAANDAFFKAKKTSGAFGQVLAAEVAPIVEAVSNLFVESAKNAGGIGNVVQDSMATAVNAIAFVVDAVHGFSVAWDGVKAAAMTAIEGIVSGVAWLDRAVSTFLDNLPGVTATANAALQGAAEEMKKSGAAARENFQNSLLEPMPGEKIKAFVQDVQDKAQKAAEEVAADRASVIKTDVSFGEAGEVGTDSEPEKTKDYTSDIERIRQSLLSEEEARRESYVRRAEMIQAAYAAEQISDTKHRELLAKNAEQYSEREKKLRAAQKSETLKNHGQLFDGLAGIAKVAAGEQSGIYKAMFAASKAFSIADSIVKIQAGIANASAMPFPANIAAMATVAAQTAGIISTIRGTEMQSFDGGGYTGSGARSGGLDGKGGFAAMLHPNETVIDHTKGQGLAPVINIIDQRSNGADIETQTNTTNGQQEITFIVRDKVQELANSGELDETMALNYGLQRVGRRR